MKDRHAAAIAHLSKADKKLGKLIRQCPPCAIKPDYLQNVFEALMESIVYQQLSGKAAATILNRVKALYFPPDTPTTIRVTARRYPSLRPNNFCPRPMNGCARRAFQEIKQRR